MISLLSLTALCAALAASGPSGGALTHQESNREAFTRPAPGLSAAELRIFNLGNRVFNTNWVVAPASASAFDGLGPTFNRVSCSGCHLRDGRGRPPIDGETELLSMLLRLSVPGSHPHGAPRPVPRYGDQLNDRGVPGVPAEGRVEIRYEELPGSYGDGERYSLRRPLYQIVEPAFGPLPDDLMVSPRVAPAVFGLGLLEAIPEASLEAAADPDDRDGDGISGRLNRVYNPVSGRMEAGRFGWKANAATLVQQNAGAANGDIGLTSPPFAAQNCPEGQSACAASVSGGEPELSAVFLDKLTQYVQMLGVPAMRHADDPEVQAGRQVFDALGCAACHTPQQQTGADTALPLLANQRFLPYTDLLLHDLGPALADGRPDFAASGSEWRTAPLWGIGLYPVTNGHQLLLHDGRARGLAEAILWHGGEAEAAREAFRLASAATRQALLAFLEAL